MLGPVAISVPVPNIAAVRRFYDRIKVHRAPQAGGTYVEITNAGSRIVLTAAAIYEYVDGAATANAVYKWSYFNSTSGAETPLSDETLRGGLDDALSIMSAQELRDEFLFGVPLKDNAGNEVPPAVLEKFIKAGVAKLEQRLNISILPRVIVDEDHDFIRREYESFIFLQLDEQPIQSVQQIRLVLPVSVTPTIVYDASWIHTDTISGQINITPGNGQILLGQATWVALTLGHGKLIPAAFRADYTAGFPRGQVPPDLREVVGKLSTLALLVQLGDLVGGLGIAAETTNTDGTVTTTQTTKNHLNSAFSARIRELIRQTDQEIKQLRLNYKGVKMMVA